MNSNAMTPMLSNFSQWQPFDKLDKDLLDRSGVYVVVDAMVHKAGGALALTAPFLYVGETCDQLLGARINQFRRSAFRGSVAHSGGTRFREKCIKLTADEHVLYSLLAVSDSEPRKSAYIRHVERALLWQHVEAYAHLPVCNAK